MDLYIHLFHNSRPNSKRLWTYRKKKMRLNEEEVCWGFLFGLSFIWWIRPFVIIASPLCGLLWAVSGAEGQSKLWRRLVCPFIVLLCMFITNPRSIFMFSSLPLAYIVMTIGYGIPENTIGGDTGSWLGRFWVKRDWKHSELWTRLTIIGLLIIAFLPAIIMVNG